MNKPCSPSKVTVDLLAAPRLGVFFDAVTASGYPSVVLDLTGMDSIDAAGLTVIVSAASSLVASGGRLTIRSSLSEIAWVLDSSWLAGLISLELTGLSDNARAGAGGSGFSEVPEGGAPRGDSAPKRGHGGPHQ